jgi:hypothetical protein
MRLIPRLSTAPLLFLCLLLSAAPGAAASPAGAAAAALPSDSRLESEGAVIGEVRIRVGEIFDPADPHESLHAYRLVNRLHRATRREVIARQLLFQPGEPYSRRVLEESERLLRADRYLGDVVIRPVRYDGHRVDVEVATRDVWTLNLGLSLGHAGGATSSGIQLEDSNFLGSGKSLVLERKSNVDRATNRLGYEDPAVRGSRFRLALGYAEASDGGRWEVDLERPFYSLDAHWSAGFHAFSEERVDSRYALGEVVDRLGHREDRFELQGGLSRGLRAGTVGRWTAGFSYRRDRFTPVAGTAGPLPADRTLAYPWIGWDWQRDAFRETENLHRMGRTEDVLLGPRLKARLGLSAPAFGAGGTALVFDGAAALGLAPGARQLLFLDAGAAGRWGADGLANTLLHAGSQLHWKDFGEHELYLGLEGALAERLDPGEQLLLGGDNGLRGYPLRYQEGAARLLLTVEQRVFTPWYPLRLARIGAAAFFDAGRVWGGPEAADLGLLRDAGVGLRLIPTRSGRASVIHLDLAFPLDGPRDLARVQWLVKARSSF